jgi:hypothetical protein
MAGTFNFAGKISLGKDTEKFHPVDRREFSSGWMNTTVKFNCISDTNRILCTAQGGKWKDNSRNVIKTFSKTTKDADGNTVKGEKIEIDWSDRFDPANIDKVAGFRKYTCDTGDAKMRYKLRDLVKAFEEETETEELIEETGIDNLDDAKEALAKSEAKKHVFLSEWDFAEHIAKVAAADKFKDKKFYISGTYDVQYNPTNGRYYTSYHVNRVNLASDDAEPSTEMKIDMYFGDDAWDDNQFTENGKCFVRGWIPYYDSSVKKNGFMPISVAVKENDKKNALLKRKFAVDGNVKQIGLTIKVIDGAERMELTMDMLDEETREEIECGLLDWEEYKRSMGGTTIGERISELRFVELTPGKHIAQDTMYTVDDMQPAQAVIEEASKAETEPELDLFAQDDEDDL